MSAHSFAQSRANLPIPIRSQRVAVRVPLDEFLVSPVDSVWRAIEADPPHSLFISAKTKAVDLAPDADTQKFIAELLIFASQISRESPEDELYVQQPLGLAGDFSPSNELTAIWTDSLAAIGRSAGQPVVSAAGFDAQQEFSKILSDWIGTLGQQLRYMKRPNVYVTEAGRIRPHYQIQICDVFLIIPDQASRFLHFLTKELLECLGRGGEISGSWGRLLHTGTNEIRFMLASPEYVTDPSFVESQEVE